MCKVVSCRVTYASIKLKVSPSSNTHYYYKRMEYVSSHIREHSTSILTKSLSYCRVSLYLDPQIRDWVLFPITIVMVCTTWSFFRNIILMFIVINKRFWSVCSDTMLYNCSSCLPKSSPGRQLANSRFNHTVSPCYLLMLFFCELIS